MRILEAGLRFHAQPADHSNRMKKAAAYAAAFGCGANRYARNCMQTPVTSAAAKNRPKYHFVNRQPIFDPSHQIFQ